MAGYGGTNNTSGAELTGGGQIGSRGTGDLQNISAVPDAAVAEDSPGAFADGQPVSPVVAARRYGAAAGRGGAGDSDPGSP